MLWVASGRRPTERDTTLVFRGTFIRLFPITVAILMIRRSRIVGGRQGVTQFSDGFDLATKRLDLAANLRQAALDRHDLHLVALGGRGAAEINLVAGQVFHHARLGADDGVVAESHVVGQTDLTGQDDIVAGLT